MDDQSVPEEPALLEVGRIDKPHGVRGEVVVSLTTHRLERLDPGSCLQTENGPLVVGSSRPHHHRHLVRFDAIPDRESAERWRGTVLFALPIDEPDDDTLWVHHLVGSVVIDQYGDQHGEVVAVVENPASDLLELVDGRLVPIAFLVDHEPGVWISVDVPDGLLDDTINVEGATG